MDYLCYKESNVYKYSEEPITPEQFEAFFQKISTILYQINKKIEEVKNHKNFNLMLIHFKKIISLIENIKIYNKINYQLIQLNISYINELSNN